MIEIKSDKIVLLDKIYDGYLYLDNEKIACLSDKRLYDCESYDYTGYYVAPGIIEMHTHGGNGHAFINSTEEDVIKGSLFHLDHGVTSILPTITAGPIENMVKALKNIRDAALKTKEYGMIVGAHMEGPYLSKDQAGAQCPSFITSPVKEDYLKIVDEYKDVLRRWTYAPENDKGMEFTKTLKENGIIPSIGHSNAKGDDCIKAYENGSNLVTHLYSCTSTITRDHGFRSLGVIESAYLLDDMYAELICDAKHLPIDLIKMIIKIKGVDRLIACTDSLEIAGTDIKEGVMSGTEFIVEDGVCKLKDRSAFAGSIATGDILIKTLNELVGLDLPSCFKMLSYNPAKLLGLNKGKLEKGYDSDVIIFDKEYNINGVFLKGIRRK